MSEALVTVNPILHGETVRLSLIFGKLSSTVSAILPCSPTAISFARCDYQDFIIFGHCDTLCVFAMFRPLRLLAPTAKSTIVLFALRFPPLRGRKFIPFFDGAALLEPIGGIASQDFRVSPNRLLLDEK